MKPEKAYLFGRLAAVSFCLLPGAAFANLRLKFTGAPDSAVIAVVASGSVDAANGNNVPIDPSWGGYGNCWGSVNSILPLTAGITLTNERLNQATALNVLSFSNLAAADGLGMSLNNGLQGHPDNRYTLAGGASFTLTGGRKFADVFPKPGIYATDSVVNGLGKGPLLDIVDSTAPPAEIGVKLNASGGSPKVRPGESINIGVIVTNHGGRTAENIGLLIDTSGWLVKSSTSSLSQTIPFINPGDSYMIDLVVSHGFDGLGEDLLAEIGAVTATATFSDANLQNNSDFARPISQNSIQGYGNHYTNSTVKPAHLGGMLDPRIFHELPVRLDCGIGGAPTVVGIRHTGGLGILRVERDVENSHCPFFLPIHIASDDSWVIYLPPSPEGSVAAFDVVFTGGDGANGNIIITTSVGTGEADNAAYPLFFQDTDSVGKFEAVIYTDTNGNDSKDEGEPGVSNCRFSVEVGGDTYEGTTDLGGKCELYLPAGEHEFLSHSTTGARPVAIQADLVTQEEIPAAVPGVDVGVEVRNRFGLSGEPLPTDTLIELELTVHNKGPHTATGLTATMTLPDDLILSPPPVLLPVGAGSAILSGRQLQVGIPQLDALQSVDVRLLVNVPRDSFDGDSFTLSPSVAHPGLERNHSDNSIERVFPVHNPISTEPEDDDLHDLRAFVRINLPPGASNSSEGVATIELFNYGPHIARNVGVFVAKIAGDKRSLTDFSALRDGDAANLTFAGFDGPVGITPLLRPGESADFRLLFLDSSEEGANQVLKATAHGDPQAQSQLNRPPDRIPANDEGHEFYRVGGHATVGGFVFMDLDGDGNLDPGEPPASDAECTLVTATGKSSVTRTDAEGDFSFSGVFPQGFALRVRAAGHPGTGPICGPFSNPLVVTDLVIPINVGAASTEPGVVRRGTDPFGGQQVWFLWEDETGGAETSEDLLHWERRPERSILLLNPTRIGGKNPKGSYARTHEWRDGF